MTVVIVLITLVILVSVVLSVINGALSATGLSEVPPGQGERYHNFAQRLWLFMAIFYTIALYVILYGTGLV